MTLSLTIVGLPIVGCGSDSDGTIDQATFAKQADAICKKISGRMSAETKAAVARESFGQGAPDGRVLAKIVREIAVPALETELREIQELGLPEGEEQQAETFFAALRQAIDTGRTKPAAFASGQSIPYEAAEVAGRKMGLTGCPVTPVTAN